MLKRLVLASVLLGSALMTAPNGASASNFPPAPAIASEAASADIEKAQWWGPHPYYRPYRRWEWGPRPIYSPYWPWGWRPRPYYRPRGFYRPRPYYRPHYW